ncbi:MAG: hypothetical protein FJ279_32455 [Planctomycetes bacterium]|nr:hypothetical protein [Planctomycetota bacterium]
MESKRLRILIIDDKEGGFGAGNWREFCDEFGCDCEVVIGHTIEEFMDALRPILGPRAPTTFHGTILDVNFGGRNKEGGVRLYQRLESENLAAHLGRLLVTTQCARREVVEAFVKATAADLNLQTSKRHKRAKFCEWIERLRRLYHDEVRSTPGESGGKG